MNASYQRVLFSTLFVSIMSLINAGNLPTSLVDAHNQVPSLHIDMRYSTRKNVLKKKVYSFGGPARCFLHQDVVDRLKGIQKELSEKGLALKIFDAYRPRSVHNRMWRLCKDKRHFVHPTQISDHSRGVAFDCTLVRIRDGKQILMPTEFDSTVARAHSEHENVAYVEQRNRAFLKSIMTKHGFQADQREWWHYSLVGAKDYEVYDIPFRDLG